MLLQKMKDMKLLILLILTGKQFSEHFNLIVCMCVLYDNIFNIDSYINLIAIHILISDNSIKIQH